MLKPGGGLAQPIGRKTPRGSRHAGSDGMAQARIGSRLLRPHQLAHAPDHIGAIF